MESDPPMPRIPPIERDEASPAMQADFDEQVRRHGRMTNMKKTLARSHPAFKALMEWYPLRDAIQPWLGERATMIFAHAISAQTDCLICSTFFRRILKDWGEDPDDLKLDAREALLAEFGRQLVKDAHRVSDELFGRLRKEFSEEQIVLLTVFGGVMIATNIFNNALRVDLDEYLFPYRKQWTEGQIGLHR